MSPSHRNRTVRSPYRPRARISASSLSPKRTRSPMRILRPGWTSACQVFGSSGYRPQQEHLHLPAQVLAALGVLLAHGQRSAPRRGGRTRRDGNTRESFSTRQSPGRRKSGNSRNLRSSQRPSWRYSTSMRDAARSSRGCWAMRLLGQVIIEVRELHGLATWSQDNNCAHPRDRMLLRRDRGRGRGRRHAVCFPRWSRRRLDTHGKYGGVVPELASREHLRAIVPVVRQALERAGCG